MGNTKQHFGGIPTVVEVALLEEKFNLVEGMEITHQDIEDAIQINWNTTRYRAVTAAWRKKILRDKNLLIDSLHGIGFRVLTPSERVSGSVKKVTYGVKAVKKGGGLAMIIPADRLTETERHKASHMVKLSAQIVADANMAMRTIEPPKKTERLPSAARTHRGFDD